jgi:hypothetical protein
MSLNHEAITVPPVLAPHEKLAVDAVHSAVLTARQGGGNAYVFSGDDKGPLMSTSYQGDTAHGLGEVRDKRTIAGDSSSGGSVLLSVNLQKQKPIKPYLRRLVESVKSPTALVDWPTQATVRAEIGESWERPHEVVTEKRKVVTNSGHSKTHGRYNSDGSSTVHRHTTHGSNPGGQEFVLTLKGDNARKHAELTTQLAARKIAERTTHQKGKPHKRQRRK